MLKKLIIANWKSNPNNLKDAVKIWDQTVLLSKKSKNTDIVACVPYVYLHIAKNFKNNKLALGAQNFFNEKGGSHTGQISASMLNSFGVSYVILGHSENRKEGEANETINQKINIALKNKMKVILCVGEQTRDHNGFYLAFIKEQLNVSLKEVKKSNIKNLIIAYEPVWAIGADATRSASVDEFVETKIFIKKILNDLYGKSSVAIPIVYGGSVNPINSKSFLHEGGADGFLVGRDSLDPKKFGLIINS